MTITPLTHIGDVHIFAVSDATHHTARFTATRSLPMSDDDWQRHVEYVACKTLEQYAPQVVSR